MAQAFVFSDGHRQFVVLATNYFKALGKVRRKFKLKTNQEVISKYSINNVGVVLV